MIAHLSWISSCIVLRYVYIGSYLQQIKKNEWIKIRWSNFKILFFFKLDKKFAEKQKKKILVNNDTTNQWVDIFDRSVKIRGKKYSSNCKLKVKGHILCV